nr:MAG TPA: hypothetical protein [Caudoviricetes sp.]
MIDNCNGSNPFLALVANRFYNFSLCFLNRRIE